MLHLSLAVYRWVATTQVFLFVPHAPTLITVVPHVRTNGVRTRHPGNLPLNTRKFHV